MIDDLGSELHLGLDPPHAFVTATRASVRRWRLARILKLFPQAAPINFDSDVIKNPLSKSVLQDFFGAIAPMAKGKASLNKLSTPWSNTWAPSLVSAINGGQWTQTRKCKVVSWQITDLSCQFYFAESGTVAHRFACKAAAKDRSVKPPPKIARLAQQRLSDDRLALLKLRGVAAIEVLAPIAR